MRWAIRPVFLGLSTVSTIFTLGACGSSLRGKQIVPEVPRQVRGSAIPYECIGTDYFLVEDGAGRGVDMWGAEAQTCTPPGSIKPFIFTHRVRDERGDHFFTWDKDDPTFATEMIVPIDRREDATLMTYSAAPSGAGFRAVMDERGIVRIEGRASRSWPCWSHAPGATEWRDGKATKS